MFSFLLRPEFLCKTKSLHSFIHLKRNSVNHTLYVVSKLSHPVRVMTSLALVSHGNPCIIRPAFAWNFTRFFMFVLLKDPHTFRPYVADDRGSLLIACEGAYRMRGIKLNLDAKDFATFAAWSDQGNLLSTCTPRSLSEVVHFMIDVVAKTKSLDRARKCWFPLHDHWFTFFWV